MSVAGGQLQCWDRIGEEGQTLLPGFGGPGEWCRGACGPHLHSQGAQGTAPGQLSRKVNNLRF